MALLTRINEKAKSYLSSGFGSNSSSYGGRFVNKNGRANVEKEVCIYGREPAGIIRLLTWKPGNFY